MSGAPAFLPATFKNAGRNAGAPLLLLLLLSCSSRERSVPLATTTSIEGSGLLAPLRARFLADSGISLEAHVVGSGRALKMMELGQVDVVISHDPEAEQRFVAAQKPALYRQFMWNDFVIAGPPSDPAGIRAAPSAADAFRRMHDAHAAFASRNDQSATHTRELSLWRAAGVEPSTNPQYKPMGQPMAHLLRSANELDAYVLTDRATFEQLSARLHLRVLFEGDPRLRNTYAITVRRGAGEDAHRFARWLLSDDGRRVVESLRVNGRQQFHWLTN